MLETTTVARPYARAIFEQALADEQLVIWSRALENLSLALADAAAKEFLANPNASNANKVELLLNVNSKLEEKIGTQLENLLKLLAHNKRLTIIPAISEQYRFLRSEHEKTLVAKVFSYAPLSSAQESSLKDSLSKRLGRNISLDVSIDESLLGGAIIRAQDFVIDGSVRGKLNKLAGILVQ